MQNQIDCLVLSGGGAKGAFGAGAGKALQRFLNHWNAQRSDPNRSFCYIGTSAGALNACVLAAFGANELIEFWEAATSRRILGGLIPNPKWRFGRQSIWPPDWCRFVSRRFARRPIYTLYSNRALRRFVEERLARLDFQQLKHSSHLVICATNFSKGETTSFYVSDWIDQFKVKDAQLERERQRLTAFQPIRDKAMLIDCLLASAAIPAVFPPVEIEIDGSSDWFVDGGVGNNTPTREAAYFLRHVNTYGQTLNLNAAFGELFCVTLDPPGIATDQNYVTMLNVANRTYEVFSYLHMDPIVKAWERINREVSHYHQNVEDFERQIIAASTGSNQQALLTEFRSKFGTQGGATQRIEIPFHAIRPDDSLGNLLDFRPVVSKDRWHEGYRAAVSMLESSDMITDVVAGDFLRAMDQPLT